MLREVCLSRTTNYAKFAPGLADGASYHMQHELVKLASISSHVERYTLA